MRMKRTAWSRRVLTAFALLGLVGFTFGETAATTFTFPATAPTGWTDRTKPTTAEQVTLSGSNFQLENVATDGSGYKQTLGNYSANVAEIVNNTGSACEIFGLHGPSSGSRQTVTHDIWLKVSGGTYSYVIGGAENHWGGTWNNEPYATFLQGNIFLELAGGTVSNDLIGVLDKGGVGRDKESATVLTGNAMVVVSGGTVTGNVVGGIASAHNATPGIVGNTLVRILTVLAEGTSGSRVLGGSMYRSNDKSGAPHTGNTAVEIELASDTAESTFGKEIVGGSYASYAKNNVKSDYAITGNTSVSISAPNTVTFSSPIYGATVAASDMTIATVGGDSSVTIEGGTYTSGIYAAGYGSKATVAGKATLTLKSGVFGTTDSKVTIGVGNGSSTLGTSTAVSSELVIAGTIDLSNATLNDDFKTVSLQGNLTLGTNRFPSATLTVDTSRTLTLTLTEAEANDNRVILATATEVPTNLTISATNSAGDAVTDWELSVANGQLVYAPHSSEHTWSKPESGSTAWADGLSNFQNGDSVNFGSNDAQETVTLPADGARVEDLAVSGNYLFDGTTGILTASTATIADGGTFATGTKMLSINALRLTTSNPSNDAVAELILTLNKKTVEWPEGTTVKQEASNGTRTAPDWKSNQGANALIDGVFGSSTVNSAPVNPETKTSYTYEKPTGSGELETKKNKWWPQSAGVKAVIFLGSTIDFDGYVLYTADSSPRNPTGWTLEGSVDGGTTWFTLDTQSDISFSSANSAYNSGTPYATPCWTSSLTTVLSVTNALTVNGTLSSSYSITAGTVTFGATGVLAGAPTLTADTITFTAGSTIKVPASGVATLVVTSTEENALSGSVTIDLTDLLAEKTPTFAEPFPVLKAPAGLTISAPEGYTVADYDTEKGCYQLYRNPPVWHASDTAADNTWSNRDLWKGLAEGEAIPTSGAGVDFSATSVATLTIDTNVTLTALLVTGSTGGVITVADGYTFSVTNALTVKTNLTFPTASFPANTTIDTGKTFTLSGEGSLTLSTPFASAIALGLTDGATATFDSAVDHSALTGITIGSGATLDYNGKSYQSIPVTLAGGTIKNASSTAAKVGAVTLSADSTVNASGGEVEFNSTVSDRTRYDLVLNNHTLTKTGDSLFEVVGADIDSGTIRVEAGNLRLLTSSGDCTLTNTTLSFAAGAGYKGTNDSGGSAGWLRPPSGTVTLIADAGADVNFGMACIHGPVALTKEGDGTITLRVESWKNTGFWTGATTVKAGTLIFNDVHNVEKGGQLTVESGAKLQKKGSTTLTLSGEIHGAGTIDVVAGTVKTTNGNANYSGSWTVASGATLSSTGGNTYPFTNGGAMEINGTLSVGGSGDNANTFSGAITGSGIVQVASGASFKCDTGFSFSGPSLACSGTMKQVGTGGPITIATGKTLSGTGSIAGAVTLSDGAILDASSATTTDTTSTCLSLTGTVTAGGNVNVTLPTSPTTGLKLLGWSSAPTGATYTATITDPLASLRAESGKNGGLYYKVMSIDGGTSGSDKGTLDGLSDDVKRTLAEAAFDAGATSISTVTGEKAGATLSATEIENALTCFALEPSVAVENNVAKITVSYDFGISKFTLSKDTDGNPQVVVKAEVQCGETLAQLTSAATMVLQKKSISGSEEWTTVEGATFTKGTDGVYTATVSLSEADISNVKYRVLATTTTSTAESD